MVADYRGGFVGDGVLWVLVVYVVMGCGGCIVGDGALWVEVVYVIAGCGDK